MGGTKFSFELEVYAGHGSYVCGEETSLLRSIEGKRPEVMARPPYPTERGLFDQPTLLNNVETLVNVPWIVTHGGAAYAIPAAWSSGVTWQSRPALGAQLAEIGRIRKGRWVTIDVTGALQSSGVLAVAIVPASDHVATYHSAESSPSHAPRLIVER